MQTTKQIVILGGGFGGVYTALYLEKLLKKSQAPFEILIVNRDNYFVFQPMLAEVVGGGLDMLDTISPLRRLLPKTKLFIREIESIDIDQKQITLAPKYSHTILPIPYDHLVFSLGTVTDFRGMPGLYEHALPFKNLADSILIRNQIIDVIEAAVCEPNVELKQKLLTFVVGGGGFSGTEVVAELNDFARRFAKKYKEIDPQQIRVIMVHSKARLMDRELSLSLSRYAEKLLQKRGVEIKLNTRLISATPEEALLSDGTTILTKTIISTVPSSPNPLIDLLNLPLEKGKLATDLNLRVKGHSELWALGDCSAVPHLAQGGGLCPPTAQFAIRQAKLLAHNIVATLNSSPLRSFRFKALGMMGALGHHSAVVELFGRFKCSGWVAWILWRFIYFIKLPGFDRKIKVAIAWLLNTFLPTESVQIKTSPSSGITQLHFEPGEVIFKEGDVGDYLYIIIQGKVEVVKQQGSHEHLIACLGKGEYFGEMALLNQKARLATVRCQTPTDLLALKSSDFGALIANVKSFKENFTATEKKRRSQTPDLTS